MMEKNRLRGLEIWLAVWLSAIVGCKAEGQIGADSPPPPPPPSAAAAAAAAPPPAPAPLPPVIQVSERIQFETEKAVLLDHSKVVLQEVVKVMKENPHVKLIEIGGHTDSTGDSGKNLLLSQERADAVKTYLVSQGIAAERMRARGFGDRVPVADNTNPDGRDANRRVEFRIVEQGP